MSDPTAIATSFVKYYYDTFDNDRKNLSNVYVSTFALDVQNIDLIAFDSNLPP